MNEPHKYDLCQCGHIRIHHGIKGCAVYNTPINPDGSVDFVACTCIAFELKERYENRICTDQYCLICLPTTMEVQP